ncbi:hypothetical protein L596_019743 [Steinernema carpocapsae]|uniref:Uncharacterized protein n=1 Tax=Steinernema carpocapsae TaxID=34508 RepID=A0A4U5MRG1_STECR|nr:hypothetical protein L596_019743 [Steinernema carpocapsae]
MREVSCESWERSGDVALLEPPLRMSFSSVESAAKKQHQRANCSLTKNFDRRQKRKIQFPGTVTTSRRLALWNNQSRPKKAMTANKLRQRS